MKFRTLLLSAALASPSTFMATASDPAAVPPEEFHRLIAEHEGVVLDVRTPGEYMNGHLSGAKLISIGDADFQQQIESLRKDRPYYVYCRSGSRSARAAEVMKAAGFKQVYDLKGGISAWMRESLPLCQPTVQ